ncbi:MAG TPA: TRAP transporter substrate-binding protein DctP, partial [Gammaproteobacteria bacterium]|nr:TRAP transporter substrate-binding protein DctP [Gammaproteobacteria bacterium]
TGLQTGLIEIAFSSPVAALVLQWQTRVKYRTDLPVSYSYGIFAIEKGAFSALSPDDQKAVREVMTRVMGGLDRTARDDNKRAAEVLASSGVQTVPVDASDVEGWRRSIESLYPQLRERPDLDKPMFDELMSTLADYRKSHPETSAGAR